MTKPPGTCRALCIAAATALFLSAAYGQTAFRYFYDGNGQLFRVLDSSGNLVEYDYDASGNPTALRRSMVAQGSLAILNIVPQRGSPNSTVTIYGQNFSSSAAGDTVMFNGVAATVISASSTTLVVQAPNGVTTGPVSVAVGGNTVTSGTLDFTVPNLPTITSMSPAVGYDGQTVTVNVQGTNLTDASFGFQGAGGIGVSNVSITGATQASFTATIPQVGGNFVLVASNDFGPSSSVATAANTFRVFLPAGENYTSVLLAVFNTYIPPGTEPGVPAGSNAATETLSVFNGNIPPGTEPGVPAGSNAAIQTFSTFNGSIPPGTEPGVPAGSNAATETLSVFNGYVQPGTEPGVPAGSNAAFQLFSANNSATGVQSAPMISMSPSGRSAAALPSGTGTAAIASTLVAGQTVEIDIDSPTGFMPGLQFRVNGAILASSVTGSLKTYFTVPYGVGSLTLQATGQTASGQEVDSAPAQISVTLDRGLTIAGRVVDGDGRPLPSVPLTWQANGLAAEYYRFNQQLGGIPDLTGLQPARTGYVSALNYPNPQQVFGQDPMGVGLGQSYAVRFSGKLAIALAGVYQFQLSAHLGAQLRIDGQAVTDTSGGVASTPLTAGQHDVEVVYYESSGAAAVQLLWTPPGGVPGVVPPEALSFVASAGTAAIAGAGGHFQVIVPAALGGIQVSIATAQGAIGQGSVVLDQ
jgi:YD repeat-containing protein